MIKPAFGSCFGLIRHRWFSRLQFKSLRIRQKLFEDYYRDTCGISKQNMIAFLEANALYPLPESVILACSEEFFNDPAPCEIHRRAVQLRLYAEMQEMLPANQTLSMDDVHPRISLYCQDTHAAFIRLDT